MSNTITVSKDKRYRHRLLKENSTARNEILEQLKLYVQNAHEDTRRHLRNLAGYSLDPLGSTYVHDPAEKYPTHLHINTLKGYFGEIFAGLIAENFSPFNEKWEVPAYLFRIHSVAFQSLERYRETGKTVGIIPGRTGDDCLAFQRDSKQRIIRSLVCEAKCTSEHNSNMVSDAHKKASETNPMPVDILQLIEILEDYDNSDSSQWVASLRELYSRDVSSGYERYDLVSYICGRSPVRRSAWININKAHKEYSARRRLEAVETHLNNVEDLVREVYDKKD